MKQAQVNERSRIRLLPAGERGTADHGWLQANFSFSFSAYHNPERMGFGELRVLNQDHIQPEGGFSTHGHQDMEIITWVQSGELVHEDSMGNRESLGPGELQVMSAGRGVRHSEFNGSAIEGVDLLQMWILPETLGTAPSWEQRVSPIEERLNQFGQLVGPHSEAREGLLTIGQDARLYATWLEQGKSATHRVPKGRRAYVHVARGGATLFEQTITKGDGLEIEAGDKPLVLEFQGTSSETPADIIIWDLA